MAYAFVSIFFNSGEELNDNLRRNVLELCRNGNIRLIRYRNCCNYKHKQIAIDLLEYVLSNGIEPSINTIEYCMKNNLAKILAYILPYVENPSNTVPAIIPGNETNPEIIENFRTKVINDVSKRINEVYEFYLSQL